MNSLDEVLNMAKWQEKLKHSIGLSGQISEMLRAKDRFLGANKMAEIAGGFNTRNLISNSTASAIEAMTQSLRSRVSLPQTMMNAIERFLLGTRATIPRSFIDTLDSRVRIPQSMMDAVGLARVNVPQSAFDAIASIGSHHQQLLNTLKAMDIGLKYHSPLSAQIKSLDFAFRDVSAQVAAIAAHERNWGLIDDFDSVAEKAVEFAESITEETDEEIKRVIQTLGDFMSAFIVKCKELSKDPIALFVIFITLHQYIDFLTKPDAPTKEDLKKVENKIDKVQIGLNSINDSIHLLTDVFKQHKMYRITNWSCVVKLKPNLKSTTLSKLPSGFEVIEVKVHHKWVYVSYFDSIENIPKMGWIMKKYLSKPQQ